MTVLRAILVFLYTGLLYLGLPLIGWGLADWGGFLADGPRRLYALAVAGLGIGAAWQTRHGMEGVRGGKGEAGKLVRKQSLVRHGMTLALFASLVGIPLADQRGLAVLPVGELARWIGAVACALGFGLVYWSGVALGRLYSPEVTIQTDHQLITSGPYQWIRHPRYLGVLFMAAGITLIFRSWIGLGLCPPLLWVLLDRIRDEEAMLEKEFGAAWQAYRARTWRLIPPLY
jgi:protein-S-isoprenylcysteine O-methyltransferase Ste14